MFFLLYLLMMVFIMKGWLNMILNWEDYLKIILELGGDIMKVNNK